MHLWEMGNQGIQNNINQATFSGAMDLFHIHTGAHDSRIIFGDSISNITSYLPSGKVVIITDEHVYQHQGHNFPDFPVIIIQPGEQNKTLASLEHIFAKLIEEEADRSTFVLGIGGGIVCDVAGFAASVYMRGLRFGFVATTLLSQVDASVGGKNGVNFNAFKNMLGVFNQPEFVLCDYSLLNTLPDREFTAGFAEVIKAAAIRDESLFTYLEKNASRALQRDPLVLHELVSRSVKIKASVVEADEREKGERRLLNFGHTFAHAIEKLSGVPHGEAVSIGMVLAANLSVRAGLLDVKASNRLSNLLVDFRLPVKPGVPVINLVAPMKQDKKREDLHIHFILLNAIGEAVVYPILINTLEETIHDLC
jgi:3-dehydroquinate synthase